MRASDYLFIYGSLITGSGIRHVDQIVTRATRVCSGFVHAKMYDLGAYPGVVLSAKKREMVHGLVLRICSQDWPSLDQYEGYDPNNRPQSEFVRDHVDVFEEPLCSAFNTWIYLYNRKPLLGKRVLSGDYVKFRSLKNPRTQIRIRRE